MTVLTADVFDDTRARTNVKRLAAAQALTGANAAVIFATGSIVGATLAPTVSLATLPLSVYVLGLAAGTLPTGMISQAFGRRIAFVIGTGCGALCGLLAAFAIYRGSFALFCCATFLGGLYGAVSQSYRFAATDSASPEYRPKALSWVMAGGVFAGLLGPQLVQWTMNLWSPYLFAVSFLVQTAVAWWRWQCLPASMRRSPFKRTSQPGGRCWKSRGSRASSPPPSAARCPTPA